MDIGKPLIEYGALDISAFRNGLLAQPDAFWARDQATRTKVAGDRPGKAVYFYNDIPSFSRRSPLNELDLVGTVSVLRNTAYPLFDLVDALISEHVVPRYPACDVVRVQLAELPPGGRITLHRDGDTLAMMHRLHVPIVTNEGVVFFIDRQRFSLAEGVLYELNNVVDHAVHNGGSDGRIHLLIDMMPREMGKAVYFDNAKEMLMSMVKSGAHRP